MPSDLAPGPECPFVIERPVMTHRWMKLTFLHWRFDVDLVQRLVPAPLRVESFDGAAWVGLVPFLMEVGLPGRRPLPWAGRFCETNVRTYVRDPEGRSGVWFFSLDASRLAPVLTARTLHRLPYHWSRMRLARRGDRIGYQSRRRWPPPQADSRVVVDVGPLFAPDELGPLDHWLTARWIVFSVAGDRRMFVRACHPPWPLRRAEVLVVDDRLVPAAGLPPPKEPPVAHYSDGVEVQIGRQERPAADPSPADDLR